MSVNRECNNHQAHTPFQGGCSAVVDSLFIVAPIVCMRFVFGPCFVIQFSVSFVVMQ